MHGAQKELHDFGVRAHGQGGDALVQ
jgi:hypothetical protein